MPVMFSSFMARSELGLTITLSCLLVVAPEDAWLL
jgi:hypothetical protein